MCYVHVYFRYKHSLISYFLRRSTNGSSDIFCLHPRVSFIVLLGCEHLSLGPKLQLLDMSVLWGSECQGSEYYLPLP